MVRELTTTETDALITRHIGPHPANAGIDEYWLKEPGIPVWAIIGQWKVEGSNIEEAAKAYHVSIEELEAAIAFYQRHQMRIDARLAQNDIDFDDIEQW